MRRVNPGKQDDDHAWGGSKKQKSVRFDDKNRDDSDDEEYLNGGIDSDEEEVKEEVNSDEEETKEDGPKEKRKQGEEDERPDMPQYAVEGVRVIPFNLKEDREDGHFDENDNFVWAKEQVVQEDAWLEDVSAEDMESAERALILKSEARDDGEETWTERRATSVFMEILNDGETPLQALKRLGKKKKGSKGPEQTEEMKREFEELTEASDFLMRQGKTEVYHLPKEELVPHAPRPEPVLWEYKSQDGQIQGPFPSANFIAWQAQGYFKGESAVLIRRYDPQNEANPASTSAAKDLEDDFDDDGDDEEAGGEGGWVSSDTIDFAKHR
ncbi:unnamed protein product [Aphanomyces euteiches]|uniref:GYF domain-containing protein n=1 Tax=Aphanomyces euteiches TaxID=100861 RepID=A0A6G0WZT5_9STRA|nr:hypothetical protein Ae201684_009868 [Aphanomyces euteiches]KAH9096038.1 hypothetical protein Ae201684P_010241 [Aphanomyces euteiches]KAH9147236.1 hypothetical protein AeRB84_009096 [Aphanomyces euteiches]KAH9150162.1 hypothetical protein AeRB84_006948 [Aphanomyces euteiches]